jgi:prepilin-type N-terminal cleavage/methylation domain-containing protein
MHWKLRFPSSTRRRGGFTLIEVVVAITLTASVVTPALYLASAMRARGRVADDAVAAAHAADQIITGWYLANDNAPCVDDIPELDRTVVIRGRMWRCTADLLPETAGGVSSISSRVVRVSLFPPQQRGSPACTIDLVVSRLPKGPSR